MNGINVQRWLLGGLAAGIVLWLLEGAASMIYMDDMAAAMAEHNLALEMNNSGLVLSIVVSLIAGFTAVFFYAASRPRFGAGPRTAVIVAVGLWVGGYVLSLLGYMMLGLFPTGMLVMWGVIGLIEMIIATVVGASIYQE